MADTQFTWTELAFASKKPLSELNAIFIAAPRTMSLKRFRQLLQNHLPKGNAVIGIAEEPYVAGFEGQPQFRTLSLADIQATVDLVNKKSGLAHKVYSLLYKQADLVHILQKIDFKRVVMVNGSWKYSFHTREPYYVLAKRKIDFEMVSPFAGDDEARAYAEKVETEIAAATKLPKSGTKLAVADMLKTAEAAAQRSFDYNFQTGVALGRAAGGKKQQYTFAAAAYNKVVPYQTYAMHHGAAREKNFSPPHDLNHYDTVHAEVELLITAVHDKIDLTDTTVFINLLPCPTCSRMLADTPISEVVYQVDHSDGYAVAMLEAAGKTVRRIVTAA
jgi:deoxycytidylate deaminase